MLMKTILKILFLLLVILLLTNTVISDRIEFEFNPNKSEIIMHYGSPANPDSVDSIEIDLKSITLLSCIGLIGIVVFARRRIKDNNNDEDIAP